VSQTQGPARRLVCPRQLTFKSCREVAHMAAHRQVARMGRSLEVARMGMSLEIAHMVVAADLIRSRHHQAVAGRRQRPEPHNLAHKMKRELQRQRRK